MPATDVEIVSAALVALGDAPITSLEDDGAGAEAARDRMPGSVAVALHGVAQGVQILRVHDTGETRQALSLQQALIGTVTDDA